MTRLLWLTSLCDTIALCGAFGTGLALAASASPAPTAEKDRPNIVVILADDLGYGSVGCYGVNPDLIRTPHIDRLAQEGRRFTDANTTSSVCSPTRYSLVTGRYCWRTSLKREVLGVTSPLHIETTRFNLASLMKSHGYQAAAIGKWHLGYGADQADYTKPLNPGPLEIGFTYHFGVPSNHGDLTGVFVENHSVLGLRSSALSPFGESYYGGRPFMGLDAPQRVDEEVMSTLADRAARWIDQQAPGKPFFLYFTPVAIHEPLTPSGPFQGSSKAGPLGDWIHELDAAVGRILESLDRNQLTEKTLVVFSSDNGGVVNVAGNRLGPHIQRALDAGLVINGPWRGGKHSVYQGGFRVPFVCRWPGNIPGGSTCDETLSTSDLLATFAALLGEPLPPSTTGAEDSFNMLPALLGQHLDEPIRDHLITHSADGNFAIRSGPWKWIEGKPHPQTAVTAKKARALEHRPQLYNLADDPAEEHDMLSSQSEVASRLSALLEKYREQGHTRP